MNENCFKPREGQEYNFININGEVINCLFLPNIALIDLYNVSINNCFRSKKEALEHRDEILEKFKEIKNSL